MNLETKTLKEGISSYPEDSVSNRKFGKKAVILLSGGLDSLLSAKIMLNQGIELLGVKFTSPFCTCDQGGTCYAAINAKELGIKLKIITKGEDYLDIIRKPTYGYGRGMNPCVDCRIYTLKKAKEIMHEFGASFVVTGEVLGQRPMSQHMKALKIIEHEAGLDGLVVRPLSAKYLPVTIPEAKGWINRENLPEIRGKSRKIQLKMAKEFGVEQFACAAGGCRLTNREFSRKLRDLFEHNEKLSWKDINLLRFGRHFRYEGVKFIVGRDESENKFLESVVDVDHILMYEKNIPGPSVLIETVLDSISSKILDFAANLIRYYSRRGKEISNFILHTGTDTLEKVLSPEKMNGEIIDGFNVGIVK